MDYNKINILLNCIRYMRFKEIPHSGYRLKRYKDDWENILNNFGWNKNDAPLTKIQVNRDFTKVVVYYRKECSVCTRQTDNTWKVKHNIDI